MQFRVIVLPGGTLQVMADEGPFEEAALKTKQIIEALNAQGLPVVLDGPIEQHRAEVSHVHVIQEVRHEH
ncbi:MAG: hypothetical protein M3Y81_24855 [Chloroflexota bacterium]|nr:hypothetical protein [Chloroflexota bacterium]